jgi:hypothetical protein
MLKSNLKKKKQLGMDYGTAQNRLKKQVLFELIKASGLDMCFVCEKVIDNIKHLSIEHIEPWLDSDNPKEVFFDLKNITFSHLKCNISRARQPLKGTIKHPSVSAYRKGCRCGECKKIHTLRNRKYKEQEQNESFT